MELRQSAVAPGYPRRSRLRGNDVQDGAGHRRQPPPSGGSVIQSFHADVIG
jgi:hypothetical protein